MALQQNFHNTIIEEPHADALKQQYANAFANAINEQEPLLQYGQHTADGAYLDFTVPQNMIPSSLDTQRGARIMKIHKKDSEDDNVDVTVFVSNKHKDWFDKKADKFATAETEKKNHAMNLLSLQYKVFHQQK